MRSVSLFGLQTIEIRNFLGEKVVRTAPWLVINVQEGMYNIRPGMEMMHIDTTVMIPNVSLLTMRGETHVHSTAFLLPYAFWLHCRSSFCRKATLQW